MPDPLAQAFARAEDASITLQILRERLAADERIVDEALELNQREQHSIRLAQMASRNRLGITALAGDLESA